jgi:1-acyl-sn-glycerol-3-phosphate acyltransferase
MVRPMVQVVLRSLLGRACRLRVTGAHVIPRHGAFVLAANHASHADTAALLAALPAGRLHDTHPLAARDYFFRGHVRSAVVRLLFNAEPIDRTARLEAATDPVLALLARGHGVILFPEGTRSVDGRIGRFKQGVGRLLAGRSWPAIPVALLGTGEVLRKGSWCPRPRPIEVIVGEPVSYGGVEDTVEGWRAVAADLERRVRRLKESGETRLSASTRQT